ncbi:MAG: leucine-rich repeat protein, partial [Bacteroidaceae bacterium]|nr:leucine-rich repeat protein [Bacteroidaceae bacterium]
MKKLLTLFALMLLCIGQTFAYYDFEVDGIYYRKLESEAYVTFTPGVTNTYSGAVSIPSTVTYNNTTYNVTSIGREAFHSSGLTSITIPSSVTSIGWGAFDYCIALTSVTIPNSVTSIEGWAFCDCSGLTSITIPGSVTSIGESAFNGCSSLTSVTNLSSTPQTISNDVFSNYGTLHVAKGCKSAYETADYWKNFTIVDDVILLADGATFTVDGIYYNKSGSNATVTYKKENDKSYSGIVSIPATVTYGGVTYNVTGIGDEAFGNCSDLSYITIPNSVTSIGIQSFYGCSGLKTVTIPSSVTSIGDYAFRDCSGLTSINIPGSVTSIGNYAFQGCSGLTSMTIMSGNTKYDSRENCNAIIETSTNTLIAGCKNTTIPNSVQSIGRHAFEDCRGLTSVTIPNSVKSIGSYAFYDCTGLTSVTIGNSVTSIEYLAFAGCRGLTSINIPGSMQSIGSYAFYDCTGLTSVDIPNSVTSIGEYAFYDCTGLTSVIIPNSVTSIGKSAFQDCAKLKSLTCMAAVPPLLGSSVFNFYGPTIHVLEGAKSIYEAANGWKNYTIVDDVPAIKLTSMTLDKSEYACEVNGMGTASVASYLPEDASIKLVTWSIDDPSIAFLDTKTGQFVGLKDGVTTITATAADGSGVTASAVVRVGDVRRYTVKINDSRMGSVSESGYCIGGVGTTISAVPNEGYEFVKWQYSYDGSGVIQEATTSTISNFLPDADVTFTAIFQEKANTEVSGLANTIYLEPFSAVYGQTVEVSVRMKNSIAATGFQFNMYLPEGVSVVKDGDGFCDVSLSTARTTAIKTNTFDASVVSDGSLMVLAASTKNFTFSGNDGEVVRLKLAVSKDLPEGEYPIVFKNIEITDASGTPYRVAYLKTNMSVTSYRLGDVNADGSISVADFSAIASHIMENTPTGFVEQAADVNQDGFVTVSDLSSLVPIIIAESTGGASHSPKMKVRSKVKTDISGKDNIIYASDVEVAPGKDFTVSFNMKNLETAMTGFQYNVTLPEGITVCKDGDGFLEASLSTARTTTAKTNTFDASIVSDGTLMVLAASTKNFTFSGTDGEVVTVKMHANENLAAGTYDLSIDRIELTDDKGTPFRPGEAIVSAITVKAPQALTEVDFDFTDPASLGITPAAEIDDVVDITAPITKGAVTATVDGGVEVTIDDDAYILEIDRGGALTLSTTAPS